MAANPRLQQLTDDGLDSLITKLKRQGTTNLVILGVKARRPISTTLWPEPWRNASVVYRLTKEAPCLAQRLACLNQLTSLNLAGNQIGATGAEALASLTQLTCLNLAGNNISDAGAASLAALTQLTSLDLSSNNLGDAGITRLVTLTKLSTLNLAYNKIGVAGASALASLNLLTSLDMSSNNLGDAGVASLARLTQLAYLSIRSNNISDRGIVYLQAITQLTSLCLGNNLVGDSGAAILATLKQLTTLDLNFNRIGDSGVVSLSALDKLISLNLSNNLISDAGPLSSLKNVECLTIKAGNSLAYQPPEIVGMGDSAILNYLREIGLQGLDRLYEAKVLILGEGGAGKTSLLRRLYRQDLSLPNEEESTKGIDIHRHQFALSNGKAFRLNVWDFGGQNIYHATHQFFLTKRSLYILVDDTRNNSKTVHDEGFRYWLEVIEALSDSSPVLIFQNEKSNRSKSIDEAGIKGRFPNVIDVYRGNLERVNAAEILEEATRLHVQTLPHVGDAVPAQWVAIRHELENLKEVYAYITQKQYFKLYCRYLSDDISKALLLSQYFHDLGVFLHFQDDQLLQRYVILQNDWATEAVFKVLDDEPTKARNGYFTRADCQRIWSNSTYAEMHPELVALMEKFELCFKLHDQQTETWLLPQLLSPSSPVALGDWTEIDDLVLIYQYDFLPKGLISRLMVRKYYLVQSTDLCWVGGAYFKRGVSELLAHQMESRQEIELRARGSDSKALLSVIASDLDALNASFEGLRGKVRKLVPCICSRCRQSTTPERYEELRLMKRRQDNKLMVECPESYENVSVLQLLDGLKLDHLPDWAQPKQEGKACEPWQASNQDSGPLVFRSIRIFLASSSELKEDRDSFELYIRQENDRLRTQGICLEVNRWENFLDAMSETRLQDEYNKAIRSCDIFVSLFKTKTGKYTEEEFDVAHASYEDIGKPLIYTYFMRFDVPNDRRLRAALISLWDFQEKLSALGHFHTEYTSLSDLQLQFRRQLDKLIEEKKL